MYLDAKSRLITLLLIASLCLIAPHRLQAEDPTQAETQVSSLITDTLSALNSLITLQEDLRKRAKQADRDIKKAQTDAEKKELRARLEQLQVEIIATGRNISNIAANTDMSALMGEAKEDFDLKEEVFAVLEPALKEMKRMTSHVRNKSEIRDKIAYYQERIQPVEQALQNTTVLLEKTDRKNITKYLEKLQIDWQNQLKLMQNELQAAELQLRELESSEESFTEASQSYLKTFFEKRGRYLFYALLVVISILLASRLIHKLMRRFLPGYRKEHRGFRTRLLELLHRVITVVLVILGPMLVFYAVEDWVLFSLGLLLLFGIGWTLRTALPHYWHQIQIFLNIGSVREGERIFLENLPWRVKQINLYTVLDNPTAGISQRVPIGWLVDLKSRPIGKHEPWFPCRLGDWVILSDGVRGKVTGISHELVQLIQRGGAHCTYLTTDFLAKSPLNLSPSYRIKESIGINYSLQKEAVTTIPETLCSFIEERAREEDLLDSIINLRVEFEKAGESSLDLVVIADFKGEMADLYNRMRRSVQRWCVAACVEYGWEIPFPQLTVHQLVRADSIKPISTNI